MKNDPKKNPLTKRSEKSEAAGQSGFGQRPSLDRSFTSHEVPKRRSLTVRLTDEDYRRLAVTKAVRGESTQEILERAVLAYIDRGDDAAQ